MTEMPAETLPRKYGFFTRWCLKTTFTARQGIWKTELHSSFGTASAVRFIQHREVQTCSTFKGIPPAKAANSSLEGIR